MTHETHLHGCAPTPLAHYLKALGILRLVAEQADPEATGHWQGEHFVLTSGFDSEELESFFLETYAPTPIVAPWNGGSGFYPKDNATALEGLAGSATLRLAPYRAAIALGRQVVGRLSPEGSPSDREKERLLTHIRAEAPDELLSWFDAAVLLGADRPHYPPLLGTGGNDGRLDFTNNFMQRLVELIDPGGGASTAVARAWLPGSLWGEATPWLPACAVGQFSPGGVGGPNATAGFEAGSLVNPWDFVFMLEGALLFAAAATRRMEGATSGGFSYPFTVHNVAAGSGATGLKDERPARAELWVPLWSRRSSLGEMKSLFNEGRATVGRRSARDGLDFARAVAGLGIDRGITAFQRYAFLRRSGKAYLATPLARQPVRRAPDADLLAELDRGGFLDRLRSLARRENTANVLAGRIRRLEGRLFSFVTRPDRKGVQGVLESLGAIQQTVGVSAADREALPRPTPRLTIGWVEAADDASPEFRIAIALAGIRAPNLPMAPHLAPVDPSGQKWDPASRLFVWRQGGLVNNLGHVAERRLLRAAKEGLEEKPFDFSFGVGEGEVAAFLAGATDDRRIERVVGGLVLVEPPDALGEGLPPAPLPAAYAVLKPLFVPDRLLRFLGILAPEARLPLTLALVRLLAAGHVDEAVDEGWRRLRIAGVGLPALLRQAPDGAGLDGPRLLATLLIPITPAALARQLRRLTPIDSHTETLVTFASPTPEGETP